MEIEKIWQIDKNGIVMGNFRTESSEIYVCLFISLAAAIVMEFYKMFDIII